MSKKLKKKVPQLRFPEFKDNWESNYLDQIGEFKNGFNADKQAFGSGVEFVNLMDIFGKSEIQKTYLERVEIPEKQLEQYKLQKGDVLFVRSSVKREGVGQSCLVNDDFEDTVYSGFIIRFREKSNTLYHLYKKYCFAESSFRKEILSFATSSANTNINQDSLSQILLFYPSIAEQEKIASFLGAVDRRLTQLRRKQELLQTYKRDVMQKIFSQQIRFTQPDGSPFPDWEKKKLGKIASFFSGGTPSSTEAIYYSGEIPFIKSGEISSGKTEQYLSKEGLENSSAKIVEVGDLLYALYGATSGEVAISKMKGAINQAVLCIRSKAHKTVYLFNYLKSQKNIIIGKYLQGGQGNLSAEIMKGLIVPTPCIAEQEKIADFLTTIDRKIEALSRQIYQTEQFKKGLLQKMFV